MIKIIPYFLSIIMFYSCVSVPIKPAETYEIHETVALEGIKFKIHSSYFASEFYNWVNQPSYPNATFLIVDISVTNLQTKALPFHFQPVLTLVDENGIKYEKSDQQTFMINMGRRGGFNLLESLNPNVTVTQKYVFDVPKQKYKLQVMVPFKARLAYGGYQNLTGRYFYFDLSNIADSLSNTSKIGKIGVQLFQNGVIVSIIDNSPAAEAGLKAGDIITKIDGHPIIVGNLTDIVSKITGEPDRIVELTVLRSDRELTFKLKRKAF